MRSGQLTGMAGGGALGSIERMRESPTASWRGWPMVKDGDFLAPICGQGTKFWGDLANKVVSSVRHVEAKYFSSSIDQLGEGIGFGVFGAESSDELGAAGMRQFPA